MKVTSSFLLVATFLSAAFSETGVRAQSVSSPAMSGDMKAMQWVSSEMTDGELRRIDKDTKRITLKHGEIKNLGMPGMTMAFQVKDPAMLDSVKTGDKVSFNGEKAGGARVVTQYRSSQVDATER